MRRCLSGLFAIAEIFAVLSAGSVLGGLTAKLVLSGLGIDPTTVDEAAILAQPSLEGALVMAVPIGSRFFWLLAAGFLILRLVHGVGPRAVGVGKGGHGLPKLLGAGVLLFAFGSLPFKLVLLADSFVDFGQGIEAWQLYLRAEPHPRLEPPAEPGRLTVASVAAAGSAQEHARRVREWATEVWRAWEEHHGLARRLAGQVLERA